MARTKVTKRFLDKLKGTDKHGTRYFDTELKGFFVRAYADNPHHVFGVLYGPRGKQRQMRIGRYDPLTLDQARDRAREILSKAALGEDPVAAMQLQKTKPDFGDWVTRYLAMVKERKRSWKSDETYLGAAAARWGMRPLESITAEDVRRMFESIREHGVCKPNDAVKGERGKKLRAKARARWKESGPRNTTANRWLASLRACLSAAWRQELIPDNPAMKVKALPENPPRQRVLSDEELSRVLSAIAEITDPFARAAFTLLIETGARGSEVLRARWEDLDLEGRLWRLPRPKAGKPQVVPLADSTVAMLRNLKRIGPWIVPGLDPSKPRTCLKNPWKTIQEKAEVPDVHVHDIRRTFGLMAARRYGLHVASKLLRHSAVNVTERVYAPLGIEELRAATNGMSKERGKVIPIRPRRA